MLIGALWALGYICYLGGRPELWAQYQAAVEILPPDVTKDIGRCIRCYADPVRASPPDLDFLDRKVDILDEQFDPSQVVLTAVPALHLDRLAGCRPALWRVVESGRQGDAVGSAIEALVLLSLDDFRTGRWDQAEGLALESLALGQAHKVRITAWLGWYSRGMVSAARGHHASAKSLSNEIVRWALPRGALSVRHCASLVKTLSSLGQGDFEAAYHHATSISPAGQLDSFTPQALWVMMDLVEAAVRTGRVREARAHVDAIRQAEIEHLSPRLRLLAEAATALVAPEASAGATFERALSIGGVQRWSFDLGRVKLLYGEHLRRTRATLEARSQLRAAQETFECLGAVPWLMRARQELRAAGLSQPIADDRLSAILTPQEYEIARLAATGLTNKEIGTRLYLSHRTVSAHLYRIFPKLGITARAALRDALDDFGDPSRSQL